jgi:HD superfamily phosphohydrolase
MTQIEKNQPSTEYKIIHDTIHGTIKLAQPFIGLLDTPEIQRLNCIHQLGLSYLVFPGAHHTRLEHSLGTYHVALRMAQALKLPDDEVLLVTTAGLLHDLGHGPFSHTFEYLLKTKLDMSHTDLTRDIIMGNHEILNPEKLQILKPETRLNDILEEHNIDAQAVTDLICTEPREFDGTLPLTEELPVHEYQKFFNTKQYLFQIIHSSIDADQIDYLQRDSHYTGVAYGVLDLERLIQTIEIYNNDLVINKSGLSAVESMLVARTLMYSTVYFHKTVRIAELMLTRAMERLENEDFREYISCTEAELINGLWAQGGLQKDIMTMLVYRQLFKRAFHMRQKEVDDSQREALLKLDDPEKRMQLEDTLADRAGVPEGHVIIDAPVKELKFSEPRIQKTDIKILDKSVKLLSKYTPLAQALKVKDIPDWAVMVATDKKYIEPVQKVVNRVLFG